MDSAHVPCRPAPYRESTRKPRGRSRRPPIRLDWPDLDARTREIQRLLFRYYKSSTSPNTRFVACGLGSCTLQTRPIPREHQKTAWEEHETSDTSGLTRLRRTHTRDSTATFPLLQVEHEARHPALCMWTRLMYPADPPHTARVPENRVGGAGDLRYVWIGPT